MQWIVGPFVALAVLKQINLFWFLIWLVLFLNPKGILFGLNSYNRFCGLEYLELRLLDLCFI